MIQIKLSPDQPNMDNIKANPDQLEIIQKKINQNILDLNLFELNPAWPEMYFTKLGNPD